jgi:hypothetical protein
MKLMAAVVQLPPTSQVGPTQAKGLELKNLGKKMSK